MNAELPPATDGIVGTAGAGRSGGIVGTAGAGRSGGIVDTAGAGRSGGIVGTAGAGRFDQSGRTISQTHRGRRALVLVARLAVSAALLVVVFARVTTAELIDVWPESIGTAAGWLVAAVLVTSVAFVLAAVRWWEVAHTLGLRCRFGVMLNDHLAGQFISNFLPTTIGGDVLRVKRIGRVTGDHYRTFASVVIERLTGWFVLPLMTLVALALDPSLLTGSGGWGLLVTAISMLLVLGAVLWGAEHPRGLGRVAGGTMMRDALSAIHVGLLSYRRRPRVLVRLLLVGLFYQALLVVAAILAAASIGVRPGVVTMFAFIPIVLASQVLPISIGGLGVREAVLVVLLSGRSVPVGEAVSVGLLMYSLTLVVSLVGAPALALGGRRKQASGSQADGSEVDGSRVDGSRVDGSQADVSQVER